MRARLGLLALACSAACGATGALAQAASQAGQVVVTASRTPQRLTQVLADVSVLEREAIERSGASCAADLLATLPGVEFARSGGPGGITSVFIRGAEARHVAVFIDGVRVDDQGTGGARWELLPIDNLERIEVLRGPAAAVYGSDAVAGVVQLFTRRGGGASRASASLTAGSDDTLQARAGASGSLAGFDLSLSGAVGRSRGWNALETATSNPDRDGWRRSSLFASLGRQLDAVHRVDALLNATNLRAQFDQSRTADDVAHQTLRTGTLRWAAQWSADADTSLSLGQSANTYESQPSFYRTETTLRNIVLQHNLRLGPHHLSALLERKDDRLLNPATAFDGELRARRHQDAVGLSWRGDFGAYVLQAQLRHDQDSAFGGHGTGSLAWGWQLQPQWRVTASVASAFRAPTLYQRGSQYGVDDLRPETARNAELGLRWGEGPHGLEATLWRNQLRNLINFGAAGPCKSSFGCYENVGRARTQGLTLAGRSSLAGIALRGSLDWHDPRNLDTDKRLARRAARIARLSADTTLAGWGLGLDWQASSARWDDAANTRRLDGYGVLAVRASRALAPGWTLEGRIDNLADRDYQLARNYPTGGRQVQLTLRWQTL